uniref:Uncharacterized protein n=1 Tax=Romanomermis culicivorax TaxID=13658 RepID=A0A915IRF8_ROMCU
MQEKSKSTTNLPRMTTAMVLTGSIMSLQATSPACSNENRNPPFPCATQQLQDVLTSARSTSFQYSFLQVAMMSTMDTPQLLALPMIQAASLSLSRTISLVSHTTHDADASAKQALLHAMLSHASNCNCQQSSSATDNDLQCQPCNEQVIDSITNACALNWKTFDARLEMCSIK